MTEARKFDSEKPRTDLLPAFELLEVASVLGHGAEKYGVRNYLRGDGLATSRVYAAALRHLFAWSGGEDRDEDSGLSHLAHAACCVLMLMEIKRLRRGADDRGRIVE